MKNTKDKNVIAFWGYPSPEIIEIYKSKYPNATWVDFDVDFGADDCKFLPDAYCRDYIFSR